MNAQAKVYDNTDSDLYPLARIGWYQYKGFNEEIPIGD